MDMVCVGMSDPLNTPIDAYIENGWMKARGTWLWLPELLLSLHL
jgi:dipeptidase D